MTPSLSWRAATVLAAVLLSLAASVSPVAFAQDSPATADDLLERAIRLREQRRDAEALPLFRRAFEMWPSPRTEAQLGLASQAVGDWASAYRHLAAALAARTDPWIAARRAPLEEALGVVRASVGLVTLSGAPPDTEVRVGGRAVARLPQAAPIAVAPGVVTLELVATGYLRRAITVRAVAGQHVTHEAELALDPAAASSAGSAPPPAVLDDAPIAPRRRRRSAPSRGPFWAWIAAGTAVAMAGGAAIAWWRADEAYGDLENGCGRSRTCTDAQIDDSGARSAVTWTNVLLVGSAAMAAGAVVLFIVEPSDGEPDDARAHIGVGAGSVQVRGRF